MTDDFTATLPRKRMGAGLVMTDPSGRVLLVEPVYKADWEVPGGAVEADESPRAATIRELGEELGDSSCHRAGCWSWIGCRPAKAAPRD